MANQITGVVLAIGNTTQVAGKDPAKPFITRDLVLDCTFHDPHTGVRSEYENTPQLEFSGDSVAQLDKCNVGDVITVSFRIRGVRYTDKSGQPRIFTRINPYQVDVVRTANAPAYQQPVQPAPQYQQPVQQPQQAPPYRPASAPPQQPAPANYQSDLPFDKPNSNDLPY
jgi:hypothetical protein